MRRRGVALAVAMIVAVGCGADDRPAPVTTENDDSPSLASPTPTPTSSASTPSATPPTATAPSAPAPPADAGVEEGHGGEDQAGGAGDEEAARTPVDLVLDGEGLTPPRVEVAPFLAIEVRIRNDLPRDARLVVSGRPEPVRVPAGDEREIDLQGLRRGRSYTVDAGPGQDARLVAVGEPGP